MQKQLGGEYDEDWSRRSTEWYVQKQLDHISQQAGEGLPEEVTFKLHPTRTGWEMVGMREVEVHKRRECIRQKEEHMQRPRSEKGTEHSKIQQKISL